MKNVMVDQDGVLLDKQYRLTCDLSLIGNTVKGLNIIPNSDTPLERVKSNFFSAFGFIPETTIAEKGAVVQYKNQPISLLADVRNLKKFFIEAKKILSDLECEFAIGDSATWIREGTKFSPNKKLMIIDGFRKQSIGFYLRVSDKNGIAQINDDWFNEASSRIRQLTIPDGLIANDYNESYGIVIMNAASTDKTSGYHFVSKLLPAGIFYMIGDGDSDIIEDAKVIHCSVANASSSLKQRSSFVADKPFTEGLVQCLEWIALQ